MRILQVGWNSIIKRAPTDWKVTFVYVGAFATAVSSACLSNPNSIPCAGGVALLGFAAVATSLHSFFAENGSPASRKRDTTGGGVFGLVAGLELQFEGAETYFSSIISIVNISEIISPVTGRFVSELTAVLEGKQHDGLYSVAYINGNVDNSTTMTVRSGARKVVKRAGCTSTSGYCYSYGEKTTSSFTYNWHDDEYHDGYYESNVSTYPNTFLTAIVHSGNLNYGQVTCANVKKWQDNYSHSYGGAMVFAGDSSDGTINSASLAANSWVGKCNGDSSYWTGTYWP